jgi:Mg2+ and Co2+ transporter CorA
MPIGVILFDPPLVPKASSGSVSEEFEERIPTLCEKYFFSLTKNRDAFTAHPFLVLSSVYGFIAEEWIRTSKYIKRELQAIEFNLEIAHHNVSQCEEYLVHLAAYRRRISCYIELARQQLAAIESFGCKAWIVKSQSKEMIQARRELREDFVYIVKVLEKHSQRLNHNLELLLGLRAVELNRIMASFALVGVFFLPFNVVAAILGMPGEYGPGTKQIL